MSRPRSWKYAGENDDGAPVIVPEGYNPDVPPIPGTSATPPDSYKGKTEYPELELDSILMFGKHKGAMIEDLIEDDPSYIQWMMREDVRQFSEEVLTLLDSKGLL